MANDRTNYFLGLDTKDFQNGLKEAQSQVKSFGQDCAGEFGAAGDVMMKMGPTGLAVAGSIGAITGAATLAGREVGEMVGHLEDYSEHLEALKAASDVNVQSLQVLGFEARQSRTDIDAVTSAVDKMEKNLGEGATAFDRLGLDVKKLKAEAPDQVFNETATAIRNLPDAYQRAAAASEVFGKQYQGIMKLIMSGDLEHAREEAQRLGITLGDDDVAAAAALEDQTNKLSQAWEGARNQFAAAVIQSGAAQEVIEDLTEAAGRLATWARDHKDEIGTVFYALKRAAVDALPVVEQLARTTLAAFGIQGVASSGVGMLEQMTRDRRQLEALQDVMLGTRQMGASYVPDTITATVSPNFKGKGDDAGALDFQRRMTEAQKAYSDALASSGGGLEAQIAKIDASTEAKSRSIEADERLTRDQKNELEAILQATAAIEKENVARQRELQLYEDYANAQSKQREANEALQGMFGDDDVGRRFEFGQNQAALALNGGVGNLDNTQLEAYRKSIDAIFEEFQANGDVPAEVFNAAAAAAQEAAARAKEEGDYIDMGNGLWERHGVAAQDAANKVAEGLERESERLEEIKALMDELQGLSQSLGALGGFLDKIGLGGAGKVVGDLGGIAGSGAQFAGAMATGNVLGMVTSGLQGAGQIVDLVKSLFGGKSEVEKIADELGTTFGQKFSDSVNKAIEDTEKSKGVGRVLAEELNLDKIMGELSDPAKAEGTINHLMGALKLGYGPAKDEVDQLGKAFSTLQEAAKNGDEASEAAMRDMIIRAQQLGLTIPGLNEALKGMYSEASSGFTEFLAGLVGTAGAPTIGKQKADQMREQAAADLASGAITQDQYDQKMKNISGKESPQASISPGQAGANEVLFNALYKGIDASQGLTETFQELEGPFDEMVKRMPAGKQLEGGAAEFQHLEALMKDAGFSGAAKGAEGLGKMTGNLLDAGGMTPEVIQALSTSTMELFNQAKGAKGATDKDALEAILPELTQLQKVQAMGGKLTPDEIALLKQADDEKLLPLKDVGTQQLETQKEIARNTAAMLGRGYSGDGGVSSDGGGATPTGAPIDRGPGYKWGGIAESGSGTYKLLHGREGIISPDMSPDQVNGVLRALGMSGAGGGGGSANISTQIMVNVTGGLNSEDVLKQFAQIVTTVMQRNVEGAASAMRSVMNGSGGN